MLSKIDYAHELGHALLLELSDHSKTLSSATMPKKLDEEFIKEEAAVGLVEIAMKETDNHLEGTPVPVLRNIRDVWLLGGIFGELLLQGRFSPFASGSDIEEFILSNRKSKSKYVIEMRNWARRDKNGLFKYVRDTDEDRRHIAYMTVDEVRLYLPGLYKLFMVFVKHIDIDEFMICVSEWFDSEEETFTGAEIFKYVKRILV